jgi:hypothetical protein
MEEDLASSLLRMQNLTSIVNDPKADTIFRQMQAIVGAGNPLEYKPLKESHIPDSYTLPKIQLKDFSDYLSTIREVRIFHIINFHMSAFQALS